MSTADTENSTSRGVFQVMSALFLATVVSAVGCSRGEQAVVVRSPLENVAVELQQTLISKQDELDVATDMIKAGRGETVARILPASMDDLPALARRLTDAAKDTGFQSEAAAIAEEVEKLPPLARKNKAPESLKGTVAQLGERVSALVAKVRES